MKKFITHFMMTALFLLVSVSGSSAADGISASAYKAGDVVEIKGKIAPGQDLYLAIAQQEMFAPNDTTGVHEVKRLKSDAQKSGIELDTKIPPLYYLITNVPEKFGKVDKKKFGGPSVLMKKGQGIYSTTMFYLKKKFNDVDA
ncbi:MAG: sulfite exporter TauE/SafE family protein, partial [Desulfobacula sp.]|nr:sulfite exporter TauE/SafE family protein [Desulfobacula sp.]